MWCAAQGTSNTHGTALRDHAVQGQHTEERTTASTDRSPLARRARRWWRRARCDRVRTLDGGAVVRAQRAQNAEYRLHSGTRLRSKSGNCWAVGRHCFLPPRQAEEDIMGGRRHAAALPQHFRRTGTRHTLCAPECRIRRPWATRVSQIAGARARFRGTLLPSATVRERADAAMSTGEVDDQVTRRQAAALLGISYETVRR